MTPIAVAKTVTHDALVIAKDWLGLLIDGIPIPLENDEEKEGAAEWLRVVKEQHKQLETKRKEITDPMNQALRAVNDLFRPAREALEDVEKRLKLKIAEYLELQARANVEALEAAAAAETPEEASEALATLTQVEAPKGVSVRYVWRAEVFATDLVPYEFLSPDLAKIDSYTQESVRAKGEPTAIPGVRFHKEPIVTSRKVK